MGKRYRYYDDGEKIFTVGHDVVFCSGRLDKMTEVQNYVKQFCIEVDIVMLEQYMEKYNLEDSDDKYSAIEVIVARVNPNNVSSIYTFEKRNNYRAEEKVGLQTGAQIWASGFKTEEVMEKACECIYNKMDVLNIYKNTYEKIACNEIGGNLKIFQVTLGNAMLLLNQKINESGIEYLTIGCEHGIVADILVGKAMLGEKLQITNADSTMTFKEDGLTVTNGINTVKINPTANEEIFAIKKGEDNVLHFDINGNGHFAGEITAKSGTIGGFTINQDSLSGNGVISGGIITGASITAQNSHFTYATLENCTVAGTLKVPNSGIEVTSTITGNTMTLSEGKLTTNGSIAIYNNDIYCRQLFVKEGTDDVDILNRINNKADAAHSHAEIASLEKRIVSLEKRISSLENTTAK